MWVDSYCIWSHRMSVNTQHVLNKLTVKDKNNLFSTWYQSRAISFSTVSSHCEIVLHRKEKMPDTWNNGSSANSYAHPRKACIISMRCPRNPLIKKIIQIFQITLWIQDTSQFTVNTLVQIYVINYIHMYFLPYYLNNVSYEECIG